MIPFSDIKSVLDYELRASWWASWISNTHLQDLVARYFAWKVKRKFSRYQDSKQWEERLKTFKGGK